jgi:MFS transporter, PPP family, 3-phenylpropionic acid transporter
MSENQEDRDASTPLNASTNENLDEPLLPPPPSTDVDDRPPFGGMLLYCSLYFFHGISGVTWGRFGIVYYNEIRHLSDEQIGILQGVIPLIALLSQPFWGTTADWFQSKKTVYLICKAGSTVALLALSLDSIVKTFLQILLCVACMAVFCSGGVLDANALDFLGEKHRGLYGFIRMWASISWGAGCILMGYLTDKYGFEWNFVIFGIMMTAMLIVAALGLPAKTKSEQARYDQALLEANASGENGVAPPRPKLESLFNAIFQLPVIYWLCQGVVIGAGVSLVDSFLFVYLQNDLHASTRLCGWTVGVTVLLELPVFFYSNYFLQTLGHDRLFLVAMAAYVVRVFGYTLLQPSTIYYVFALEILHGVTISTMWVASVDFAAAISPDEWSTTVQTILSTAIWGVGGGLGPMIGGWVMQDHGAIIMYRGAGLMVGASFFIHLLLWSLKQEAPHAGYLKRFKQQQQEASSRNEMSTPIMTLPLSDESQQPGATDAEMAT